MKRIALESASWGFLLLVALFLLVIVGFRSGSDIVLAQFGGAWVRTAEDAHHTEVKVPSTSYDLSWWTVDGGGASPGGGTGYSLGGTAGQPDAAVWSGDSYTLAGGFWGGAVVLYRLHLPLVLRGF